MSIHKTAKTAAFGVEPGLPTYRFRQARYKALAEDIGQLAMRHMSRTGRRLQLLDVGFADGVSRRYIEAEPGGEFVDYHGVDLEISHPDRVYKGHDWTYFQANLEHGMPDVPSQAFDVIVCEQVLEHLHNFTRAIDELIRVTRVDGTMFVGVPIFPPGIELIRRHLIPRLDRLLGGPQQRSHVQAFTRRSFVKALSRSGQLAIGEQRGFRIVSGGILRPFEYVRWCWQLNRWIGTLVPGLCIEVQVVAQRQTAITSVQSDPCNQHGYQRTNASRAA